MSNIKKLKNLRKQTGVSYSVLRKALDEVGGDVKKAQKILHQWGTKKAIEKKSRKTSQGTVFSYIHHNQKIGVLLEVLCQTDFVAKNSDFKRLGHELAMQIASTNPKNRQELIKQPYIRDENKTIETLVKEYILKIGEKIKIGRFVRYQI